MLRATAVKLAAAVLVLLELWALPGGPLRSVVLLMTIGATLGFFAYVITAPSSQFLVPSVCALPAGSTADPTVAFTFDDGPDPEITPRVLDLLARHGAQATFFVVGARAAGHPDLIRRIVAEGHAIGSHTYEHSHVFHFSSASRMRAEVTRGIDAVTAITGTAPRLFRPPQGVRTPLLRDALASLDGLVCVTWTERGLDAIGRASQAIASRLARSLRAGAILALHDGAGLGGTRDRRPTLEALEILLEMAKARGLRCVSLACLDEGGG
jgi:peptidoglycan/xylan/chitin deacetylase (PgdA/CDA1 family)